MPDDRQAASLVSSAGGARFRADLPNGLGTIDLAVEQPPCPAIPGGLRFAEHRIDGAGRSVVNCVGRGRVAERVGEEGWRILEVRKMSKHVFSNHFTLSNGHRLLQGVRAEVAKDIDGYRQAVTVLCSPDGGTARIVQENVVEWHGSCSIDEAGGVIMYAEYALNFPKYRRGEIAPGAERGRHRCRVFRSMDGGESWDEAFSVNWDEIRHFHTVKADPYRPGRWWLTSGDKPYECRVWRSDDNGGSWTEVTDPAPSVDFAVPAAQRQSIFRQTDQVILEDAILWGSDDHLGAAPTSGQPSSGAGVFMAAKDDDRLRPRLLGFAGNPVRSIVDVDFGWLFITEAKNQAEGWPGPLVLLLLKDRPDRLHRIAELPTFGARGSSMTASKASRRCDADGVFFTYRGRHDLFEGGEGVLEWRIRRS